MKFGVIIALCSEIRTKHIKTLCGQNVELLKVKLAVHIITTGLFDRYTTVFLATSLCQILVEELIQKLSDFQAVNS